MGGNFWKVRAGGVAVSGPTLAALSLTNPNAINGVSGSTTVVGATSGSTLTLTDTVGGVYSINSGTRTLSWSSSVATGTDHPVIRETLSGATNTPRDTTLTVNVAAAVSKLAPSAQWAVTGVPGSGFGTANPALPTAVTRTVAKPSLRFLTLPHHLVTGTDGTEFIAIQAHARRIDGAAQIDKVRVWCEGNYVDLTTRSTRSYTDFRGTTRKYRNCFFAELDYAVAQTLRANGSVMIIAEAWASDGTFQKQITATQIIHFRPGSALTAGSMFQTLYTVGPSGSGATYDTLGKAMSAAAALSPAQVVGIKILTTGRYKPQCATTSRSNSAKPTIIFPDTGVTATMGDFTLPSDTTFLRPFLDSLIFLGIDWDNSAITPSCGNCLYPGNGTNGIFQWIACNIYNGDGATWAATYNFQGSGAQLTVGGGQPGQSWINANPSDGSKTRFAFKDCSGHDMAAYGLSFAEWLVNCDEARVSGSCIENISGIIHNCTVDSVGGVAAGWMAGATNIAITNSGGGTATISKPTLNGYDGNFIIKRNGVAVVTINITGFYSQSMLVSAINATTGTSGFSATTPLSNPLSCQYIAYAPYPPSAGIGTGTDPEAPFTSNVCNLTLRSDIHANCCANYGPTDNIIGEFVKITNNIECAPLSFELEAPTDLYFANFDEYDISDANNPPYAVYPGYWGFFTASNVILQNLTMAGSNAIGAYYVTGANGDSLCTVLDSYLAALTWQNTDGLHPPDPDWLHQGVVSHNAFTSGMTLVDCQASVTESAALNGTTHVPVVSGPLFRANSHVAGAKCPAANADSTNDGWLYVL